MKRLITLSLICAALTGCANHALKEGEYRIDGTAENMDGQTIYLYIFDEVETVDSSVVKRGRFQFSGSTEAAVVDAALVLQKFDRKDYKNYPTNICSFYIEPTEMTVTIAEADSLQNAEIHGSKAQDDSKEFQELFSGPSEELNHLYYFELRPEQDPAKKDSLQKLFDTKQAELTAKEKQFKDSHVGSYFVFQDSARLLTGKYTLEQLKSYYDSFEPSWQKTAPLREIKQKIEILSAVAPGQPAPDFKATDINGNEFSLSSLKGHYILLDFWASWCRPCRESNPHILALMKKYKGQGFEVVGVADDDETADKWHKAIADDGTESFHHVLRGYMTDNDILNLYAVYYLPTKYLIDPEGKIVGQLSDEEIDNALKKAYGF